MKIYHIENCASCIFCQDQILKKQTYLKNGWSDWYIRIGVWIDTCNLLCDLARWSCRWPCLGFSMSHFGMAVFQELVVGLAWNERDMDRYGVISQAITQMFDPTDKIDLGFFKIKLWNTCISGMDEYISYCKLLQWWIKNVKDVKAVDNDMGKIKVYMYILHQTDGILD